MSRGKNEARAKLQVLNNKAVRKANMAILMFSTAVADRLGLSLTDMFCGELLSRTGPITAGELAELTGLTTGAITGVIDRLEKNGYVRRENDPHDRRRVILQSLPEHWVQQQELLYQSLNKRFDALYALYTDTELVTIAHFIDQLGEAFDEEAALLRNTEHAVPQIARRAQTQIGPNVRVNADIKIHADARTRVGKETVRDYSAPLRDVTQGKLEWSSGACDMYLVGMSNSTDLVQARFEHTRPDVRVEGGNISVQYRQWRLFGREGGTANVRLNAAIPWALDLHAGASKVEADLRALNLRALNLKMGSSHIELRLPATTETATLRFETSASQIDLSRPEGIPMRVETEGNDSKMYLDREEKNVGRDDAVESPGYKRTNARYLVQIIGGANKIEINTDGTPNKKAHP